MPRKTTKVLTGVALAALAAAAVAAAMNHRPGQRPNPDEDAHLDELDARLSAAEGLAAIRHRTRSGASSMFCSEIGASRLDAFGPGSPGCGRAT